MSLQHFPYDVLFTISVCLDIEDVVHLSNSCKQLRFLHTEPTLCRRIIENCASFTSEAEQARIQAIDYPAAVMRLYRRRKAFSVGVPAISCVVGSASDFLYNQGILVFVRDQSIHVMDIHGSGSTYAFPMASIWEDIMPSGNPDSVSLLHYSDGVLSLCLLGSYTGTGTFRLAAALHLESTLKLFVRNTRDYLFYGTHSAIGSQDHHEWLIRGYSLNDKRRFAEGCSVGGLGVHSVGVQLLDFPGSDIGSTVVFKIHDGYFYALSNCTSFSVVEIDWTSFYHCIRFPINDPTVDASQANPRLYRRQHSEGPIHDSWTDLSLQVDERTNELKIVEARQEWLDGRNQQSRTFYMRDIKFSAENTSLDIATVRADLVDDRFSLVLTSQSNYARKQPRHMWQIHPEDANYAADCSASSPSFILTHTKFRSYNLSTNTFLDIVDDDSCCLSETKPGHRKSCLRLRSGNRALAPVTTTLGSRSLKGKERAVSTPASPVEDYPGPLPTSIFQYGAVSPYQYSPITLWPRPAHTSAQAAMAHRVLHPDLNGVGGAYAAGVDVKAVADERSVVILMRDAAATATSQGPVPGKIVCLCFDGNAGVRGLPKNYDVETVINETDCTPIPEYDNSKQLRESASSTDGSSDDEGLVNTPESMTDKEAFLDDYDRLGNLDSWTEDTSVCDLDLDDAGWGE